MPTVDRMHAWHRAGDVIFCAKCGAGANDDPTECPPVRRKPETELEGAPVQIKRIVCPKCKRANNLAALIEHFGSEMSYDVEGEFRSEFGYIREGDATGVEAFCKCGHHWMLKGVLQLPELTID
jgi:hypothetical protein